MYALTLLGAVWVLVLVVLLLDLSGLRRRGAYIRWQGAGLLILMSGGLADSLAEQRGWPLGRLHVVHFAGMLAALAGLALFGAGLRIQASARAESRTRTGT